MGRFSDRNPPAEGGRGRVLCVLNEGVTFVSRTNGRKAATVVVVGPRGRGFQSIAARLRSTRGIDKWSGCPFTSLFIDGYIAQAGTCAFWSRASLTWVDPLLVIMSKEVVVEWGDIIMLLTGRELLLRVWLHLALAGDKCKKARSGMDGWDWEYHQFCLTVVSSCIFIRDRSRFCILGLRGIVSFTGRFTGTGDPRENEWRRYCREQIKGKLSNKS